MSIVLQGSTSGSITLQEPAVAGSNTINLPAATGTAVLTGVSGNVDINAAGSNNVTLSTNSTERMRIDSSGNVGIGTSSPNALLNIQKADVSGFTSNTSFDHLVVENGTSGTGTVIQIVAATNGVSEVGFSDSTRNMGLVGYSHSSNAMYFFANETERMRIDSSGNLLVGTTSTGQNNKIGILNTGQTDYGIVIKNSNTSTNDAIAFFNSSGTRVGLISYTTSATTYGTSSDYRLKENIAPMTGALAKVQALKPVTYNWKVDGSAGQGFIAHELQEVVPDCVTGEKDAVDAEGNPVYQGVDTSFLVATLTAAIQEQQAQLTNMSLTLANANAMIEELKARIETLEAK